MTETVTPGREELLALKSHLDNASQQYQGGSTFFVIYPEVMQELVRFVNAALDEAKPADEGVREAFKPFSDFMAGSSFSQLPDEMKLTNGSSIARRQLTVGDFKTLRSAIWPSTTGEQKR